MKSIPYGMIKVLLDKSEEEGARHDAAMDLSEYNFDEVLLALQKIAQDPNEEDVISSTSGESLGEILTERQSLEWEYLKLITFSAYRSAYNVIKDKRPEWIEEVLKEELRLEP